MKKFLMITTIMSAIYLAGLQTTMAQVRAEDSNMQLGLQALAKKQFPEAAQFFETAYKAGNADGAFFLGSMAELGTGTEKNIATAVVLYQAAAEADNALALQRLGLLQFQGEGGLLQDFEAAHTMLCKSADLGLVEAMVNCAQLYQSGRGLEQNTEKALEYYQTAIDLSFSPALVELARMYSKGVAIEKDEKKAHELLKSASDLGNVAGLYHMALAAQKGNFGEKNLQNAHMYFNLASARGHEPSKEAMMKLSNELSPEDVKASQKAAIAWTEERQKAAAEKQASVKSE
ncbi:hypothetical protein GN278_12225 [Rhodobacteraceae bacterium Araon29]